MSAARAVPQESLLDSVASLRMADRLVQELARVDGPLDSPSVPDDRALSQLVTALLLAYSEIAAVHDRVQHSLAGLDATIPQAPSHGVLAAELAGVEKRLHVLLAFLTRTISAADPQSGSSAPASQAAPG